MVSATPLVVQVALARSNGSTRSERGEQATALVVGAREAAELTMISAVVITDAEVILRLERCRDAWTSIDCAHAAATLVAQWWAEHVE